MFAITMQKGFHITFANGVTVSVQFGCGNYCDNYSKGKYGNPVEPSSTAEVMVWDKEGKTLPIPDSEGNIPDYEDVVGHQSPSDVVRILAYAEAL